MEYYRDEHPRHGHRSPSELAAEEILASVPRDLYGFEPSPKFVKFTTDEDGPETYQNSRSSGTD